MNEEDLPQRELRADRPEAARRGAHQGDRLVAERRVLRWARASNRYEPHSFSLASNIARYTKAPVTMAVTANMIATLVATRER